MKPYVNYSLRNFVQDEDFIRWVKYPDAVSDDFWSDVRKNCPHQTENMDKAARLVKALGEFYPEVPGAEVEHTRMEILSRIRQKSTIRFSLRYLSVAASLLFALSIGWWFFGPAAESAEKTPVTAVLPLQKEVENKKDQVELITLPDGSTVELSPESKIWYVYENENRREVRLEGEAFFKVVSDSLNPFYVYSYGLVTRVLGTSFRVSAFHDIPEVKVEVNTGRVQVYPARVPSEHVKAEGLILTPNQQAVFSKSDQSLIRSLVNQPKVIVSEERLQTFIYTDTPLSQIFEGLEEVYGIKVIYDREKFQDCRINMSLTDETLFEKLELIGKVVEGRYNVIDGQVIFIGEGCR